MDFIYTKHSQKPHFLTLPAEIRLQIFEYLVPSGITVELPDHFGNRGRMLYDDLRGRSVYDPPVKPYNFLAMLTINKIISGEYSQVLYKASSFSAYSTAAVLQFTSRIGKVNGLRIRKLSVEESESFRALHDMTEVIVNGMPNLQLLDITGIGRGRYRRSEKHGRELIFSPDQWDEKNLKIVRQYHNITGLLGGTIFCQTEMYRSTRFYSRALTPVQTWWPSIEIDLDQAEHDFAAEKKRKGRELYRISKAKRLATKHNARKRRSPRNHLVSVD